MIEITLQFDSINEAIATLNKIQGFNPAVIKEISEPAPKRGGRKVKERENDPTPAAGGENNGGSIGLNPHLNEEPLSIKADAVGTAPEPEASSAEAPVSNETYTIDDARAALARLNDKEGLEAVRMMLQSFGASRISEVNAAKYAELIGRCPAKGA